MRGGGEEGRGGETEKIDALFSLLLCRHTIWPLSVFGPGLISESGGGEGGAGGGGGGGGGWCEHARQMRARRTSAVP